MKHLLLFTALIMCISTSALAQNYTIGVENYDYMPYYTTQNGEYQGFARELLDAFAKSKGYTFTYKPLPINTLFLQLIYKTIDFKFPDSPYWRTDLKKEASIHYSKPVISYTDAVMVKPENKDMTLKDLKKLGSVLGFSPWALMDKINNGSIQKMDNPSFEGMFTQVLTGKIDGAYINPVVARYVLKNKMNKGEESLVTAQNLPNTQGDYLISTATHTKVIDEFNDWISTNADAVKKLKDKYHIQ